MRKHWGLWIALAATAASAGEVNGRVTYVGKAPPPASTSVPASQKACGESIPGESLVVGKGGALKNAVVFLEGAPASPPPAEPAKEVLDQVGCRYVPHVLAARVGDTLEVVNSDAVLHNVNAGTAFNYAFPMKGQRRPVTLKKEGVLHAKCNAGHPWMSAYVHVFNHPYFAVTGEDGSFTLKDVPEGTWPVQVWHETLGTQKATVTVAKGGKATVQVQFPEASASAANAP